jgi:hypothetical protein
MPVRRWSSLQEDFVRFQEELCKGRVDCFQWTYKWKFIKLSTFFINQEQVIE